MSRPVNSASASRVTHVSPRPRPDVEVGVTLAYLPFATPYKNVWEMLRAEEVTVKQLIAMRKTDGQARALYRLISLPIRAALKNSTFIPGSNVQGGEEEAEFIEQMFMLPPSGGGMTVSFNQVIAQMLTAIFNGFSAFEMVYWSPDSGLLRGKWVLKKLAHRPSESVTFLIDDKSEFAGLRQRAMFQGRDIDVKLPAEHTVYYACNEEERPFYGQSYFQSAFYHWDKKFKLYVIAHLAAQRAAVGTRVGKLPPNPDREEKNQFFKALGDLGVAQYMTIPEGYEVESLKESAGFDFLSYINHHNSQMSKSVLAAFFDKEQGGGDAGRLVDFGSQSDSLFLMMLQTIMGEIEEVINSKIIPRFIDWNFGSGKYPRFQFGSLSEEQKAALLGLFKTLSTAGQSLTISPEFVHEVEKKIAGEFGLEIDYETIEASTAAVVAQQSAVSTPVSGDSSEGVSNIDQDLLPPGFSLSVVAEETLTLAEETAELLYTAYQTVEATRGVPKDGGPKTVRTAAGAKIYGVPIGTPITRDIAERTAKEGVKGKNFGGGIRDPNGPANTTRRVYGGGLGAPAQDLGGVALGGKPKRVFVNSKQPGVRLLDYGDGTLVIVDAKGVASPRQQFDIREFFRFGWLAE